MSKDNWFLRQWADISGNAKFAFVTAIAPSLLSGVTSLIKGMAWPWAVVLMLGVWTLSMVIILKWKERHGHPTIQTSRADTTIQPQPKAAETIHRIQIEHVPRVEQPPSQILNSPAVVVRETSEELKHKEEIMAGALSTVIDLKESILKDDREWYMGFWDKENPEVTNTLRNAQGAVRECFGNLKAEVFRRGISDSNITNIYDRDIKTLQAYEDRMVELIKELH